VVDRVAAEAPKGVQEREEAAKEEWVAQERVQVRMENAPALSAERVSLTKWVCLVISENAQSAVQKW
jgi:hypothetical protein